MQQLLSSGTELEVVVEGAVGEIQERCGRLRTLWEALNKDSDKRLVAPVAVDNEY